MSLSLVIGESIVLQFLTICLDGFYGHVAAEVSTVPII